MTQEKYLTAVKELKNDRLDWRSILCSIKGPEYVERFLKKTMKVERNSAETTAVNFCPSLFSQVTSQKISDKTKNIFEKKVKQGCFLCEGKNIWGKRI